MARRRRNYSQMDEFYREREMTKDLIRDLGLVHTFHRDGRIEVEGVPKTFIYSRGEWSVGPHQHLSGKELRDNLRALAAGQEWPWYDEDAPIVFAKEDLVGW